MRLSPSICLLRIAFLCGLSKAAPFTLNKRAPDPQLVLHPICRDGPVEFKMQCETCICDKLSSKSFSGCLLTDWMKEKKITDPEGFCAGAYMAGGGFGGNTPAIKLGAGCDCKETWSSLPPWRSKRPSVEDEQSGRSPKQAKADKKVRCSGPRGALGNSLRSTLQICEGACHCLPDGKSFECKPDEKKPEEVDGRNNPRFKICSGENSKYPISCMCSDINSETDADQLGGHLERSSGQIWHPGFETLPAQEEPGQEPASGSYLENKTTRMDIPSDEGKPDGEDQKPDDKRMPTCGGLFNNDARIKQTVELCEKCPCRPTGRNGKRLDRCPDPIVDALYTLWSKDFPASQWIPSTFAFKICTKNFELAIPVQCSCHAKPLTHFPTLAALTKKNRRWTFGDAISTWPLAGGLIRAKSRQSVATFPRLLPEWRRTLMRYPEGDAFKSPPLCRASKQGETKAIGCVNNCRCKGTYGTDTYKMECNNGSAFQLCSGESRPNEVVCSCTSVPAPIRDENPSGRTLEISSEPSKITQQPEQVHIPQPRTGTLQGTQQGRKAA